MAPAPFPAIRRNSGPAPYPMPRSARPAATGDVPGTVDPHSGGGLLGNAMGWNGNGFYDGFRRVVDSGVLDDLGYGLLNSTNFGDAMAMAGNRSLQMAPMRRQDREEAEQRQKYAELIGSWGPEYSDFAAGIADGAFEPGDGYWKALQYRNETTGEQQDLERARANAQFLQDPELRGMVEAGAMSFEDAYKYQAGGAGSQESFFGTAVPMQDAEGNIVLGQMSNQGNWQPLQGAEGFTPAPTTKTVDIGNYVVTQDVYGNELYRTPKSGAVPTGYGAPAPDGSIAPMPGGEQDRARIEADLQFTQRAGAADERADVVINAIDTALGQAHWSTTGPVGSAGRAVGMTGAVDLEKTIDTVIANIGFNELQQMREMSPTGGALGQVAVQELAMLQSVLASLDPRQGEEQLRRNLETVQTLLERQKMFRQQAIEERQNNLGGGQPGAVSPGGQPTAINKATGERVMFDGQQWVPAQ